MIPTQSCQFPGCESTASRWYLHTGSGIRFLCKEHWEYISIAAAAKKVRIANGAIGTAPSAKEMKQSWKR